MNVFKSIVMKARRHLIILGAAAAVLVGLVLAIVWWPKATILNTVETGTFLQARRASE